MHIFPKLATYTDIININSKLVMLGQLKICDLTIIRLFTH